MEKTDRLIHPELSKNSLASVTATVDAATTALGGFLRDLRSAVSKADAPIRQNTGSLFANVAELCMAEMQGQRLAVQELLSALTSSGSKNKETLSTYLAQCNGKTELGTSEGDR